MTHESPRYEDDPDAPPSPEEERAAAELRVALEDASVAHPGAELARALAVAHEPRALGDAENRELIERALAPVGERSRVLTFPSRRPRVTLLVGAASLVAMAAGVAIYLRGVDGAPPVTAMPRPPVVHVRSTQPLFAEPFARTGGASARVDRIAIARAGDLRDNRFSAWGVK